MIKFWCFLNFKNYTIDFFKIITIFYFFHFFIYYKNIKSKLKTIYITYYFHFCEQSWHRHERCIWIWKLICKAPTGQYADRLESAYENDATSRLLKMSKESVSAAVAWSSARRRISFSWWARTSVQSWCPWAPRLSIGWTLDPKVQAWRPSSTWT